MRLLAVFVNVRSASCPTLIVSVAVLLPGVPSLVAADTVAVLMMFPAGVDGSMSTVNDTDVLPAAKVSEAIAHSTSIVPALNVQLGDAPALNERFAASGSVTNMLTASDGPLFVTCSV